VIAWSSVVSLGLRRTGWIKHQHDDANRAHGRLTFLIRGIRGSSTQRGPSAQPAGDQRWTTRRARGSHRAQRLTTNADAESCLTCENTNRTDLAPLYTSMAAPVRPGRGLAAMASRAATGAIRYGT
jgi:hypothetical protein